MQLEYPRNTVWFIQAGTDTEVSEGSAVAIRLRKIEPGDSAMTYLLTCAHVIRKKSADGKDGFGPIAELIRAWPPNTGFGVQEAKEVEPFLLPLSKEELSKEERENAVEDWVVLKIRDSQSASSAPYATTWLTTSPSRRVTIYGYPGGSQLINEGKGVVIPKKGITCSVEDGSNAILRLTGTKGRPGLSGGGVFTRGGVITLWKLCFAGIHRSRYDPVLELQAVACLHIQNRLKDLGYEPVSHQINCFPLRCQVLLVVAALLFSAFLWLGISYYSAPCLVWGRYSIEELASDVNRAWDDDTLSAKEKDLLGRTGCIVVTGAVTVRQGDEVSIQVERTKGTSKRVIAVVFISRRSLDPSIASRVVVRATGRVFSVTHPDKGISSGAFTIIVKDAEISPQ